MKGTIRTKEKCPVCQKAFAHIPKLGFLCSGHKTTPTKVYLDLSWNGQRIRIFSDKQGQPLDSYQRALNLQGKINFEIENHIFDSSKYQRVEAEKFWAVNLLEKFQISRIGTIAPSYQKDFKRMVKIAKDFFGAKDLRDLRKMDIADYKEHLEKNFKLKGKTVKNILDLFKTFLRYCRNDLEVIETIPPFPPVELQERKFKWLDQEDQIALFKFVPDEDKPIISFLMLHGCRPSEARALKVKDVNLKNQTVTISANFSGRVYREKRKGRGAKSVTVPIHPEMSDYVSYRVNGNLPEAFLFVNPRTGQHYSENRLRRVWETVRTEAKIGRDLRLYDATRDSFASQLVNSGTSLFKVSKLLGHSSVKMTEKYSHENVEELRADLQKVSLKKVMTVTKPSPEAKADENII